MPIPEEQFPTLSNQGAMVSAQAAHTSTRAALAAPRSPVREVDYDVYLQGS
jgi:hypothetical protein